MTGPYLFAVCISRVSRGRPSGLMYETLWDTIEQLTNDARAIEIVKGWGVGSTDFRNHSARGRLYYFKGRLCCLCYSQSGALIDALIQRDWAIEPVEVKDLPELIELKVAGLASGTRLD